MRIFPIIQKYNQHSFFLTNNETYFMRLALHDFNTIEIADFLDIAVAEALEIRSTIKKKIGEETWYKTIAVLFKLHNLKPMDYVDQVIAENALMYAKQIHENLKSKAHHSSLNTMSDCILEFYDSCPPEVLKSYTNKIVCPKSSLLWASNITEVQHIIVGNETLRAVDLQAHSKKIFRLLEVDNWFTAFKKLFDFGFFNEDENVKSSRVADLTELVLNISFRFTHNHLSEKEFVLMIYEELLKYYNTIQYTYLIEKVLGPRNSNLILET